MLALRVDFADRHPQYQRRQKKEAAMEASDLFQQGFEDTQSMGHGYALIIGVDENQIRRLAVPTVAKDVQAMYDVLTHPQRCAYRPENVKLLKGQEATRANIFAAIHWLQDKVKEDGNATAIIYFSGQAMVDKNAGRYYLVPYDIGELSRLRAYAIKAEAFATEINRVKARQMLTIMDCCHAEGMTDEIDFTSLSPDLLESQGSLAQGWAILNSSAREQSSYVRTDQQMSLFTYHVIEALTGHASPPGATAVYVADMMDWVSKQVAKSAQEQHRVQTPVMRMSSNFPVAMLMGESMLTQPEQKLPDPLEPLPPATSMNELDRLISRLFSRLSDELVPYDPTAVVKIQAIEQSITTIRTLEAEKAQIVLHEIEEDQRIASLIDDLVCDNPIAAESIIILFTDSIIAKAAGEATKWLVEKELPKSVSKAQIKP